TDASEFTATASERPRPLACSRYVTWPRCRTSNTPLGTDERTRQRGDARERIGGACDLPRIAGLGKGFAQRGAVRALDVLEDLDHALHARRRGGDLAGGVALVAVDDAHQVHDAPLGHDLDVR